jgi:hypothetical protein
MGATPLDVRIDAEMASVDREIVATRDAIYERFHSQGRKVPIDSVARLTRLLERRHALLTQKTYPQARVYTQLEYEAVMAPDGTEGKLRGKTKRRLDIGVLYDGTLHAIETKVDAEIRRMFQDDPKARDAVLKQLRKSSKGGRQLNTETGLYRRAARQGPYLLMSGKDVFNGPRQELPLIAVDRVMPSRFQVYGNLGDGLPIPSPSPASKRPVSFIDLTPNGDTRAERLNGPVPLPAAAPKKSATKPMKLPLPGKAKPAKGSTGDGGAPPTTAAAPPSPVRTTPAPAASGARDERLGSTPAQGNRVGRTATTRDADPPGIVKRWRTMGRDARAEIASGVAQAFYDFMANRMYRAAEKAALDAAASRSVRNEVFELRRTGHWVLVRATFAISKLPDAGGTRHVVFRSVGVVRTKEDPGESAAEIFARLHRIAESGPATMSAGPAHASDYRDPYARGGWDFQTMDMALYPADPPKEYFEEYSGSGALRWGRCVERRIR